MKKTISGFTIVELLIVIVVIAILAAISIVAYNGIQDRANDSAVMSDINVLRKKLELAKVDLGHYPQTTAELPDFKLNRSAADITLNNAYYITNTAEDTYAFGLRSKSMKGYILTNSGLLEGVSVSGAATGSAIDTTWGGAGSYTRQGYTAGTGWNSWPQG